MIMLALGQWQTNGARTFVERCYVSVERVDHKFTSTTEQISAVMPTKAVSLYILLLGWQWTFDSPFPCSSLRAWRTRLRTVCDWFFICCTAICNVCIFACSHRGNIDFWYCLLFFVINQRFLYFSQREEVLLTQNYRRTAFSVEPKIAFALGSRYVGASIQETISNDRVKGYEDKADRYQLRRNCDKDVENIGG